MDKTSKKTFGDLLVDAGLITEEQLSEALKQQHETGEKVGDILIDKGIISNDDLIQVLEFQLGIPHVNLNKIPISSDILALVPEKVIRRYRLMPVAIENNKLVVAMSYPFDLYAIDDLKLITNMDIYANIATTSDIQAAISKYYSPNNENSTTVSNTNVDTVEKPEATKSLDKEFDTAVKSLNNIAINDNINLFFDKMLTDALSYNAKSIHIEPRKNGIQIRFETDDELKKYCQLNDIDIKELTNKIKLVGNINIGQSNITSNGTSGYSINSNTYNLKISIIPTIHGEKTYIQISEESLYVRQISELGFSVNDLKILNLALNSKKGMILVSSPALSGVSSTFYSLLKTCSKSTKNIMSLENPCEFILDEISQTDINNLSIDDSSIFNTILKHHPDIISLSDINSARTAELAINAANTGHMVISTIYSSNTVGAITRLLEMGITPYSIANSLKCIISQRLVRTICSHCSNEYTPSPDEIRCLKNDFYLVETDNLKLYKGTGCSKCSNTGYLGKTLVFEILTMSQKLKEALLNKSAPEVIKKTAVINGLKLLSENAVELVLKGKTTLEEIQHTICD
jgi:type IV pilus assembly protein PilB